MFKKILLSALLMVMIPGAMALDNTWNGPTGGFGVYSARNLKAMNYAVSLYFANIDREWDVYGHDDAVSVDYSYFLLPVAFGITDQLELSVAPSYLSMRMNEGMGKEDGFGDMFINLKGSFYNTDSMAVGALLQAKIATADEDKGLGTGEMDYGLALLMTNEWEASRLHINAGYRMVGEPEDVEFDDQFFYGLGFESDVAENWQFLAEFNPGLLILLEDGESHLLLRLSDIFPAPFILGKESIHG